MSYYGIIHAPVRYDKNLQDFDKVICSDITALTNKKGYCTASNFYFSEAFGKSKDTISRSINRLVKEGYLVSELIYKKGTKEVSERRLYPTAKLTIPIGKNADTPIGKNAEDNNTSNNTTSNKNKQKKELPSNLNLEAFNMWCEYKGNSYKQQGKTLSANKLSKYTHDIQMQMVENSIMNNYQGLFEIKSDNKNNPNLDVSKKTYTEEF